MSKTKAVDSTILFSKTAPLKLFFIAAVPGAISMFASALYQTIDGVFVGRFLGQTAFAAVNLAMPFVIINFSLADLIGVGSAVPISVCLGKKQEKEANHIFTCACLMIVGAGAVIGGILFAAAPLLIRLMGAEGEFADLAVQYLRVYAICSPFTTIIYATDNFLRICGFIRGSMFLNILLSALSAILEFLFLGVFGWGIWAAALATCSGMFICALIALYPFFRGKTLLRFGVPRFFCQHDPADHRMRKPELPEQYRRTYHLDPDEHDSGALGRRKCDFRLWCSDVCGRLRTAAALRYVRFPAACDTTGAQESSPGCGQSRNAASAQAASSLWHRSLSSPCCLDRSPDCSCRMPVWR